MNQIPWSKPLLDEFLYLAMLTEEEEYVLRKSIAGDSRVKMSIECNMSINNIDKILRRIRSKYDEVQPFSDIMPPRKKYARKSRKISKST